MTVERKHCQECKRKPVPGKRRCKRCAQNHNLREAARRDERRRAGLCVVCGATAVIDEHGEPMSLCDEHRLRYEVRREAAKKKRERTLVP